MKKQPSKIDWTKRFPRIIEKAAKIAINKNKKTESVIVAIVEPGGKIERWSVSDHSMAPKAFEELNEKGKAKP